MKDLDQIGVDYLQLMATHIEGVYNIDLSYLDSDHQPVAMKLPVPTIKTVCKVTAIYKKSVRIKLFFDKYDAELIFYIPYTRSPKDAHTEFHKKVHKVVQKTLLQNKEFSFFDYIRQ